MGTEHRVREPWRRPQPRHVRRARRERAGRGSPPGVQPLPAFSARLRVFREGDGLVSHNFAASAGPLAGLGNFSIAELRAGLRLNADRRPVPHVELVNVSSGLGNWPTLDLSAADTVLDGLGDIVEGFIQQQLQS